MDAVTVQVRLLNKAGFLESINIAAHAALICTGNEDKPREDNQKFLTSLINKGHESVIEHIVLSFEIDGVSRALLQEWARHRLQALSVKSTRYTLNKMSFEDIENVKESLLGILPEWENNTQVNDAISLVYQLMWTIKNIKSDSNIPNDRLKYLLPECLPTKFVTTVNARELHHIFRLRSSPAALWEFQQLTHAIYEAIPEEGRFLFEGTIHRA